MKCRIDTPIEVDYYYHGGILPFVLRELLEKATSAKARRLERAPNAVAGKRCTIASGNPTLSRGNATLSRGNAVPAKAGIQLSLFPSGVSASGL